MIKKPLRFGVKKSCIFLSAIRTKIRKVELNGNKNKELNCLTQIIFGGIKMLEKVKGFERASSDTLVFCCQQHDHGKKYNFAV